ncbi:hypothetical protein HD599_002696 [Conyzicola lurida]|uniref:Maltokinase N-terminal cap domain-containing protein n=1 Tax=Conyzicola lurida TaxID=1172621 RepID=A0A841AS27_9MICO|nr:hypothetical protein [Conyzicola lurida]MBB5844373.1 hypothetical protein [Conyzicola lurida]
MALLHQATVTPSKLELVRDWLPTQPWYRGPAADLSPVAAYRFDDPEGEVGIETILTAASDGAVLQVPVTYRGAPLEGGEPWLIGTMEHSVLGARWVYDGLGDPAYLAAVATAVRTGGRQADLLIEIDGEMVTREPTAVVKGSGSPAGEPVQPPTDVTTVHEGGATVAMADGLRVTVLRYPGSGESTDGDVLTGRWAGQAETVLVRLGK